jgi:hypothetical protein
LSRINWKRTEMERKKETKNVEHKNRQDRRIVLLIMIKN